MKQKNLGLKIGVTVTYVGMVVVNFLANALPIAGVGTGEASDRYQNLFTPSGLTFSIWGLIYLLLSIYTLYQFGVGQKSQTKEREQTFKKVGQYFLLTSLANIAWIFSWHYGVIWLSVLIMLSFLFLLIKIADIINKERYSLLDKICIRLPFSVYFGWITVATIANITVLFVSLGWKGFGISEVFWTIIILLVGCLIGILRMIKDRNIFYGLVLVWAYFGILIKHLSVGGFNGQYPYVVMVIIASIVLFLITILFVAINIFSKNKLST